MAIRKKKFQKRRTPTSLVGEALSAPDTPREGVLSFKSGNYLGIWNVSTVDTVDWVVSGVPARSQALGINHLPLRHHVRGRGAVVRSEWHPVVCLCIMVAMNLETRLESLDTWSWGRDLALRGSRKPGSCFKLCHNSAGLIR